jgi:hypothetical protein
MKLVSFALGALLVTTVFATPSQAAKRNWVKYCNSGKVAQADRAKCNRLLDALNKTNATYNNAIGDMQKTDLRPTCYGNQTEYRDNCSPRSY